MLQTISVVGALAILGAYAASQFGLADASKLSYQAANFLGSAALTVVAVVDWQLGFILLEGAWALMSLWGIAAILRGARRQRGWAAKPRSSKARYSKGVFGGGV
jgi:hypothetical protein